MSGATRHLALAPAPPSEAEIRRLAAAMPERALQEHVRQACDQLDLYHYHPYDSRRSAPGWPDSTIVGPAGIRFRELKSQWGRVSPEQADVGRRLTAAGESWKVWRPLDWLTGRILAELREIAPVQDQLPGMPG